MTGYDVCTTRGGGVYAYVLCGRGEQGVSAKGKQVYTAVERYKTITEREGSRKQGTSGLNMQWGTNS